MINITTIMEHQSFSNGNFTFSSVFSEVNFENLKPFDLFAPVKDMKKVSNISLHHHHHVNDMRGKTMF